MCGCLSQQARGVVWLVGSTVLCTLCAARVGDNAVACLHAGAGKSGLRDCLSLASGVHDCDVLVLLVSWVAVSVCVCGKS
jgi:hypothetical protein